jgi:hypothetical protein
MPSSTSWRAARPRSRPPGRRPSPASRLHPNLAEIYRRKVADLQTTLGDPKTQTEALEILRGLIVRVVLHPAEKGFEIEFIGEIAAMVDLGPCDKEARRRGQLFLRRASSRPPNADTT